MTVSVAVAVSIAIPVAIALSDALIRRTIAVIMFSKRHRMSRLQTTQREEHGRNNH